MMELPTALLLLACGALPYELKPDTPPEIRAALERGEEERPERIMSARPMST